MRERTQRQDRRGAADSKYRGLGALLNTGENEFNKRQRAGESGSPLPTRFLRVAPKVSDAPRAAATTRRTGV